jgi:hypothetical protein
MERGRIHSFQLDNNEAGILEYGLLARAHLCLVSSGSTMALSRQLELSRMAMLARELCVVAQRPLPLLAAGARILRVRPPILILLGRRWSTQSARLALPRYRQSLVERRIDDIGSARCSFQKPCQHARAITKVVYVPHLFCVNLNS